MLSSNELVKIGEWVKTHFVGEHYFSFVQGFEGMYLLAETTLDCREGRQVFKVSEILSEV